MENWKWNIKRSKLKIWDNPAMKADTKQDFFTEVLENVFLRQLWSHLKMDRRRDLETQLHKFLFVNN